MNQLTKGKIRSGRRATEPVQVLRPADPPVQSLPSGLKQINSQNWKAILIREKNLSVKSSLNIQVRDIAAIYDSYNCGIIWKFGHCRPWPTKRQGFRSPTAHEWYLLDKLLFHQVRGLRSNQELCCEGSEEEEMPGEMPTRGAQGLGILLNKFNQSQINFGKYQPVIGKLRHLQWGDTRWSADGLESSIQLETSFEIYFQVIFFQNSEPGEAKARGRRIEVESNWSHLLFPVDF